MEQRRISDTEIEVITELRQIYFKDQLLKEKDLLEIRLDEVNQMLRGFD